MIHPNFSDKSPTTKSPRLLDQVHNKLRVKHYSIRTEKSYTDWIKRYIFFHGKPHPKDMEARDIEAFLTHLAVAGKVSASTQNQAKSALPFSIPRGTCFNCLVRARQVRAPKRLALVLMISG